MRHREKQARAWKKVAYATKQFTLMGVVRLGIPQGFSHDDIAGMWTFLQQPYVEPTWTYITDPKQIESILVKWQIHHYNQDNSSPLAGSNWSESKDPTTVTPQEVDEILRETIDNDQSLSPASLDLLREIKNNIIPTMPPQKSAITVEKFGSFYLHTKESKSSSPSRLHLGH